MRELHQREQYYSSPEYTAEALRTFRSLTESSLPQDLLIKARARAEEEQRPLEAIIQEIINFRRENGMITSKGFHVSNIELAVGQFLEPGIDQAVCYSDNIKNLYGEKSGKWLYIIDGANNDTTINEELGWKKTRRRIKILSKIRLNDEIVRSLDADFARLRNPLENN